MGSEVSDISTLRGMPIWNLQLGGAQVADLTPLEGKSTLKHLGCGDRASDLSSLEGPSPESLHAGPLMTDLSPLKGMPLGKLSFPTFKAERDAEILRAIPTLKIINDQPAARFWKAVDEQAEKR